MDYLRHYNRLIARGKMRGWTKKSAPCYTEWHHIIPKCVMKDNSPSNLVLITAEEHFVAHQLLVKIYCATIYKHKLAYAADAMRLQNRNQNRPMNKEIGWLKPRLAEARSAVHSGKIVSIETRQKQSDASKKENLSDETRQKMRLAQANRTDEWRRKLSEARKKQSLLTCPHCGLQSRSRPNMKRYHFDNCKMKET